MEYTCTSTEFIADKWCALSLNHVIGIVYLVYCGMSQSNPYRHTDQFNIRARKHLTHVLYLFHQLNCFVRKTIPK